MGEMKSKAQEMMNQIDPLKGATLSPLEPQELKKQQKIFFERMETLKVTRETGPKTDALIRGMMDKYKRDPEHFDPRRDMAMLDKVINTLKELMEKTAGTPAAEAFKLASQEKTDEAAQSKLDEHARQMAQQAAMKK